MDAPLGTAARANVPSSSSTSTSTVGLPRESRISRAPTASMDRHAGQTTAVLGVAGHTRGWCAAAGHVPTRRDPSLRRLGVHPVSGADSAVSARHGGVRRRGAPAPGRRPRRRASATRASSRSPRSAGGRRRRGSRRRRRAPRSSTLVGVAAARAAPAAMPVGTASAAASRCALIACHASSTSARRQRRSARSAPKTCGLRRCIFSAMPAGDVVDGEVARLLGDHRVEVDLQQQVAELLAQVVRRRRCRSPRASRGSPQQVARQRAVGLLALPGALAPQPAHVVEEVEQRLARSSGPSSAADLATPAARRV